jgi:hypothetical protein
MEMRSTKRNEIPGAHRIGSSLPEGAGENSPGQATRSHGNAAQLDAESPVGATESRQMIFDGAESGASFAPIAVENLP